MRTTIKNKSSSSSQLPSESSSPTTTTSATTATSVLKLQRTPSLSRPSTEAALGLPASGGASSVRVLAQKFIATGEENSQPQVSKSQKYPKARLIFRSNSVAGGTENGSLFNWSGSLRS